MTRWAGQGTLVDHLLHDEGGGQPLDAGQRRELVVFEALVRGEVGGQDAQEVVGVAEQALGLDDLRDLRDGLLEAQERVAAAT